MRIKRWIAGLTLAAFISSLQTPLVYAQAEIAKNLTTRFSSAEEIINLSLPKAIGEVQESYLGRNSQTVIILQDAHSIPEAQAHLRALIEYYETQSGADLVALEGAEGHLDTQLFESFPDQPLLKKVLKSYQAKGELSGGVEAALSNESRSIYTGMDDWTLYEKGIYSYQEAQTNLSLIQADFAALTEKLSSDKQRLYSKKLLTVDREIEKFYSDHSNFKKLLQVLAALQRPESGSPLALVLEEMERDVQNVKNFEEALQSSTETLQKAILNTGDAARLSLFNQRHQDFRTSLITSETFAAFLQLQAKDLKVPLSFSEELLLRIEHQRELRAIEGTRLFKQLESYSQAVKESLIHHQEQARLNQATMRLRWLKKMARLELTFEDWKRLKAVIVKGQQVSWTEKEMNLWAGLRAQQDFYRTAEKRDVVFFQNILKLMEQYQRDTVIAVVGGFHAEGLKKQFREQGISYVLVMPSMNQIPENNPYREHMRGNVSWKKYIRVENNTVNLYNAFVRSVRDRLIEAPRASSPVPEAPQLLREWRDQLIRDLAAKGRVTDLRRYVYLLDELAIAPEDDEQAQWKMNIRRFVKDLLRLESAGSLNEAGVRNLLKTAVSISLVDGPALLTRRVFRADQLGLSSELKMPRMMASPAIQRSDLASSRVISQNREFFSQPVRGRSEVRVTRRRFFEVSAASVVGLGLLTIAGLQFKAPPPVDLHKITFPDLQIQSKGGFTPEEQAKAAVSGMIKLIDAETGLVVDKAAVEGSAKVSQVRDHIDFTKTSPTNIGLEVLTLLIARDHGWISQEESSMALHKIVLTLEQMRRDHGFWYNWYDLAHLDTNGVPQVALNQFISSVDNANLAASLMVLQSAMEGTPLAERVQELLDAQEWSFFYNSSIGLMSHGYDAEKKVQADYGYGTFNTEARVLSFIAILHGVDQKAWDGMSREVLADKKGQIPVIASWGGSLFESLFADVFIGAPDPIAQNNRDMVQIHRNAAEELGYNFWGWSPSQGVKNKDVYAEAGVPEVGARDRGKGYPLGAVSPYSSLLAAPYIDPEILLQNLANMRMKNPWIFNPAFGYRDAIDPQTGEVSRYLLSLDKGMEILGFDLMLREASRERGTAEKYFWRYLNKKNMDARAKALLESEKEKFEDAQRKHGGGLLNTDLRFKAVWPLIEKGSLGARTGSWNNQSKMRHKLALDLEKRDESIFEIDADVTTAGSFGGTFHKQHPVVRPGDYDATHVIIPVRRVHPKGSFKTSFKVEFKKGGRVVQEFIVSGVTEEWQEFVFPLKSGLGTIDEVVTVFVYDPAEINRVKIRLGNIALAVENKEGVEKPRSEVRRTASSAVEGATRLAAVLLYPGAEPVNRLSIIERSRLREVVRAYKRLGADGFEGAVIAQAEALPTWAFDDILRSFEGKAEVNSAVAIGVALPEVLQSPSMTIFWHGFTAAFNKDELSELFKQGGRFDTDTERALAARNIVPRNVKLSQSHELKSQTDQTQVPTVVFDYRGAVHSMFFPLEIKDVKKAARSPKAAQFLGFLVGRILKTQADLLRRQPQLRDQPEALKKELLAALWAQGFDGLELGQGLRPNSLSLTSAAAMLVLQNLMTRRIETAA